MKKFLSLIFLCAINAIAADGPISGVPAATTIGSNDVMLMTVGGNSRKVTPHTIAQHLTTNTVTSNFFGQAITNSMIIYVRTNGNDATAIVGRPDHPWATLTNAWANISNNMTIDIQGRHVIWAGGQTSLNFESLVAHLPLINKTNVTIIASAPTEIYTPTNGTFVSIVGSSNITFLGPIKFASAFANQNSGVVTAAIGLCGTNSDIHFEGITFEGIGGNAIFAMRDVTTNINSVRVKVQNSTFNRVGGSGDVNDGTAVIPGPDWLISGNLFTNVWRGVELEGAGTQVRSNVIVSGNIFYHRQLGVAIFEDSDKSNNHDAVTIANNFFVALSNAANGIDLQGARRVRIIGNTMFGGNHGINATVTGKGTLTDSQISGNLIADTASHGMNFEGAVTNHVRHNLIAGNVIRNAGGAGISLESVSSNTISGNDFQGGGSSAIRIYSSNTNSIGNIIQANRALAAAEGIPDEALWILTGSVGTKVHGNSFDGYAVQAVKDEGSSTVFINQPLTTNVTIIGGIGTNVTRYQSNGLQGINLGTNRWNIDSNGVATFGSQIILTNFVAASGTNVIINVVTNGNFIITNAPSTDYTYFFTNLVSGKSADITVIGAVGATYRFLITNANTRYAVLWPGTNHPVVSTNTDIYTFKILGTNIYGGIPQTNFPNRALN